MGCYQRLQLERDLLINKTDPSHAPDIPCNSDVNVPRIVSNSRQGALIYTNFEIHWNDNTEGEKHILFIPVFLLIIYMCAYFPVQKTVIQAVSHKSKIDFAFSAKVGSKNQRCNQIFSMATLSSKTLKIQLFKKKRSCS